MSFETEGLTRATTLNTSLFRYGISARLEGRLQSDLLMSHAEQDSRIGLGDIIVGIKYGMLTGPVQLAYIGQAFIPSGSSFLSSDEFAHSHRASIATDLSDRFSLGVNVGYSFFENSTDEYTYTIALAYAMTEKIGFFTEVYGSIIQGLDNAHLYNHGFTYLVRDTIQLDVSYGSGINVESTFWSMGISLLLPG